MLQEIPFVPQPELGLEYKDKVLAQYFKPDFICFGKIIVEIKALTNLVDVHRAQILNYLKATNLDLGLLVNFRHHPKLEYERMANRRNFQERTVADEMKSWFDSRDLKE